MGPPCGVLSGLPISSPLHSKNGSRVQLQIVEVVTTNILKIIRRFGARWLGYAYPSSLSAVLLDPKDERYVLPKRPNCGPSRNPEDRLLVPAVQSSYLHRTCP
jgi:hypothetical protein